MGGPLILTDSFRNDGHQERKEGPLVFPDDAVQLVNKPPLTAQSLCLDKLGKVKPANTVKPVRECYWSLFAVKITNKLFGRTEEFFSLF